MLHVNMYVMDLEQARIGINILKESIKRRLICHTLIIYDISELLIRVCIPVIIKCVWGEDVLEGIMFNIWLKWIYFLRTPEDKCKYKGGLPAGMLISYLQSMLNTRWIRGESGCDDADGYSKKTNIIMIAKYWFYTLS